MFDVTNGLGDPPPDTSDFNSHTCPACLEGGHNRKAFAKRRSHEYTYFGERLSSDLCGPFPKSVDGYTYALCIVDSYSRYCALYMLKSKSSDEVLSSFREFLEDHKHHLAHGNKVTWHTDNGGEFMSHVTWMSSAMSLLLLGHSLYLMHHHRTHRQNVCGACSCGPYAPC